MYDKAIALKLNREVAMMFTDRELKATGKVHMMESLVADKQLMDNLTRYEVEIDRDNTEYEMATIVNVRAYRGDETW
jgi:hypothetical protein